MLVEIKIIDEKTGNVISRDLCDPSANFEKRFVAGCFPTDSTRLLLGFEFVSHSYIPTPFVIEDAKAKV